MAADSLQTAPPSPGIHTLWTDPPPPPAPSGAPSTLGQYFEQHDVKESSYHTFISRLDLHICNDTSSADSDSDEPPPRASQGAMQLTFRKLGLDYYPFHRPGDGCRHWERHCSAMEARAQWAAKLLQEFQSRVEASGFPGPHSQRPPPSPGSGPHGKPPVPPAHSHPSTPGSGSGSGSGSAPGSARESPAKKALDAEAVPKPSPPDREQASRRSSTAPGPGPAPPPGTPLKRLRCSCIVLRVDDLDIHQVSSGGRHSKKTQSLISCNRKALHLADNVPAIHLQFTEYYYPNNTDLPIPLSNLYGQVNGLQLCVDPASVLWVNSFSRGLLRTLAQVKAFYHLQDTSKSDEHVDLRLDASQLRLIIPLESSILDHPDRPQSLSISVPQMVLSNTRHAPHGSRGDLASTYACFSSRPFFRRAPHTSTFPSDLSVFHPLPSAFQRLAQEQASCPLLDTRPPRGQDVWCLSLSRAALTFEGARRGPKAKGLPFVEPFAMAVWMCRPAAFDAAAAKTDVSRSGSSADLASHANHVGQTSSLQNGLKNGQAQPVPRDKEAHERDGSASDAGDPPPSATVHVLAQSVTPMKVWLNHFQYVALLRMKDTLGRLAAELTRSGGGGEDGNQRRRTADAEQDEGMGESEDGEVKHEDGEAEVEDRQKGAPPPPPSVCVAFLADAFELGLLFPPSANQPEEEEARSLAETDSPSMSDSDASPTHRSSDTAGPLEDSGIGGNGSTAGGKKGGGEEEEEEEEEQEGSVEEACEALEADVDDVREGDQDQGTAVTDNVPELSPPLSPGTAAVAAGGVTTISRDASTFSLEGELSSAYNATKDVTQGALNVSLDLTKGAFSITKDAFSMFSRSSGMGKIFNSPAKDQPYRPDDSSSGASSLLGGLRLQSMKPSSSQQSLDSAILDGSMLDDRLSVASDTSDNFAILMDSESGLESMRPESSVLGSRGSPSVAAERDRDAGSTADLSSSLSHSMEELSQDMASVLLLCLNGVGTVSEVRGEDCVVAVEVQEMTPRSLGNQRLSELLSGVTQVPGLTTPTKPLSPAHRPGRTSSSTPVVALRMEMGPSAARHSPLAESVGFLELLVRGCRAELLGSSLGGLGPFLEDELAADVQPMRIRIRDTVLTLKDNGPRVYPTAPQPIPVVFSLDGVVLERSDDGVFTLRPGDKQSDEERAAATSVVCSVENREQSCGGASHSDKALGSQLCEAQSALSKALSDRELLLQEVRKYDPSFTL
ncbi:bridge-like lipid transfer protein family member 3A isoform X2 [Engraulis encrasicolus]